MKKFAKYSPNIISQKDVEAELLRSREDIARLNQSINYFHGDIDRSVAEKLLRDHYYNGCDQSTASNAHLDGLFLIRKCSASADDFSLSMICMGNFYHYRINHSIDAYYVLDDGPLIHGLDELIKHYQYDPHGLPSRLNARFIPKHTLPCNARIIGNTNPLHLAVSCVSEVNKVKMILKSAYRPDINEKDDNGRTALHIACEYDNIGAVEELLLDAGCLRNIRAKDGSTPLHTAAEFGAIQCLEHLLDCGKANPMERNMSNNWVPMHEAASRDHYTCVNALLNHGLPDKPRTADNQTPLDLAIEAGHKKTVQILKNYVAPEARIRCGEFLHEASVTREIAKQLLDNWRNENGAFLVRRTARDENILVLSLTYNGEFFNYEICVKEEMRPMSAPNEKFYFIDDGPYFRSLPHLIEHYNKYEDGLPGRLTRSIPPVSTTPTFQMEHQSATQVASAMSAPRHLLSQLKANIQNKLSSGSAPVAAKDQLFPSLNSFINGQMTPQPQPQPQQQHFASNANMNSLNQSKSDALTKANLFKSRTLLNDQKRRSATQSSKRLCKISMSEIQLQAIIGEGEFGTVYKGTYNGKQVAVKKLKDCTASNDFMREADIMGTLNNPCILKIFGLVQDKSSLMMVQELMIGSILEKLWQSPQDVTENHLKLWSSQIALGMQHMEDQKIVHRDLAARNVLLASMHQIKISDFGLSRSTDAFTNAYTQKTEGKIPIKWYSPESIEHLKFTSKSDVWSFGVTVWEMFSYGDQPYGNMNGSEVYMYIQANNRLQRPPSCPKNTYKVMLQCWEWQEEKRPTFKELNLIFQNDSDYQKTLPVLRAFR